MPCTVDLAIAKTHKYASRESGDTAQVLERPGGGISVVVVDGQGSGRGAKTLSMQVSGRVVNLLLDGARDGAAARVANDFLLAYRHGQVSATLDIITADPLHDTLVLTRLGATLAIIARPDKALEVRSGSASPLGRYAFARPTVDRFPLRPGTVVVTATDGIATAGERSGNRSLDWNDLLTLELRNGPTQVIADTILSAAIQLDSGRPADDMTVAVVSVRERPEEPAIGRFAVAFPIVPRVYPPRGGQGS